MTIKKETSYYDCQKRGVDFLAKNKYGLLAFEQGLGKTLTSLSNRDLNFNSKILVVCPAYLVFNWRDEIKLHTNFNLSQFTIISYERMTKSLEKLSHTFFDFIIFDESHYLKNKDAKRTKAAFQIVITVKPKNLALLTGTPAKNRVESLWSQIRILALGRYIPYFPLSFYAFKKRFIEYEILQYGNLTVEKEKGVKNLDELREILKSAMLIEKVKDNLDLPDATSHLISLENSREDVSMQSAFTSVNRDLFNLEKSHISSFKRDVAITKTGVTIQFIKDFYSSSTGKSLVVFSCHPDAVTCIAESLDKFKIPNFKVDQKMSAEERNKVKNAFQEGEKRILIATIGTFSTGVTLTKAHHMIFNDYPWDIDDLEQAKSRIRRIGQKSPCFYHFVVTGPLDKQILKTISQKKDIKKEAGL